MTNVKYMYETTRGKQKLSVDVDTMSEDHLRNALKKLIRDAVPPKGEVVKERVWTDNDTKTVNTAIKALDTARQAIALIPHDLTFEGEKHWDANNELLLEVHDELQNLVLKIVPKENPFE